MICHRSAGPTHMIKLMAYMSTPGGLTGAPRRLLTLARVLKAEGVQVCVATQSGSALIQAAEAEGFATVSSDNAGVLAMRHGSLFGGGVFFRLRVLGALLVQNWRFRSLVRCERGDVIWIRGSKGIAFAGLGALISRRPLVWDVDYELPSRGLVRWLHRFGLWAADAVVFQYRAAADGIFGSRLASRYRAKFHAIIPGIDLASLAACSRSRATRAVGKEAPFRILQVGTICERKNQHLLIEALQCLSRDGGCQSVEVRLAGGVFEEAYAEDSRRRLTDSGLGNVVQLLGWRDDVHALMAEADLLVMPSKDEGVPNTVQEAMAIGLPVMVSNAGGMPEVVSHGKTGWVLPADDPEAWAKQIDACRLDRELCREVGEAAAAYAAEHFGTESWGRQYAGVIKRLVPNGRRR